MYTIQMNTNSPYSIIIKDGLILETSEYIKKVFSGKKVYIVADERVAKYHLNSLLNGLLGYETKAIIIKGHESAKSLNGYSSLCKKLIEENITRTDLLIAFGGGVIGDLVGFVAKTLYRGIPYIQIPTSLLAQVDSSIGGKTGIDFLGLKNIIGAFNSPLIVLIDPSLLKTLPLRELKNGYGEIIKHALISSKNMIDEIRKNGLIVNEKLIYDNLLIKKSFVESDEFDKGMRMSLNFGHTFGHVIELNRKNCLHGEAVLSGILCSIDFAIDHGNDLSELKNRILCLYNKLKLNYHIYNYKELLPYIKHDKKNLSGYLNLILITKEFKPYYYKIEEI